MIIKTFRSFILNSLHLRIIILPLNKQKRNDMKEFKGTKGKWIANKEEGYDYDILCDGFEICWLGLTDKDQIEQECNAKLIAAAPNLLEALQMFVDYCYGTEMQNTERFKKGIKAIEKALK